ncbi:hypothetical protein MalM25_37000 [Planctomycetes bacterium MalM25]|nr:hypothetical protein MalM25_37000 [Planctomycetes bacterium MalM25]
MPTPNPSVNRRDFLAATAAGAGLAALPTGTVWAKPTATTAVATPESLVKLLHESFSPRQRETLCFAWDAKGPGGGPLRRNVNANWQITDPALNDDFFNDEQRELVRAIFEGIYNPEWHERIDRQLDEDAGGFGESNSIAIFGEPGSDRCEFVMTGRHMTVRCDGNTTPHFAFGGPIFYGHDASETPDHEGNVFWPQGLAANELYQMLDNEQRDAALVRDNMPRENRVKFRKLTPYQGIPVAQLSGDQQEHLRGVLNKLVEPYRTSDQEEALDCLAGQRHDGHSGLDACHLAYYEEGDLGGDGVWDNWRLEGPSFVWHYRGNPHVHVWVNVADDPTAKITTHG